MIKFRSFTFCCLAGILVELAFALTPAFAFTGLGARVERWVIWEVTGFPWDYESDSAIWRYPDPGNPNSRFDHGTTQAGIGESFSRGSYNLLDSGIGAGTLSWNLYSLLPGATRNVVGIDMLQYFEEGSSFEFLSDDLELETAAFTLPLPDLGGDLRIRATVSCAGIQTRYQYGFSVFGAFDDNYTSDGRFADLPTGGTAASADEFTVPFIPGDEFHLQAYGYLHGGLPANAYFSNFQPTPVQRSVTGAITWTTGPSFPGDTTDNPATNQTRQTPTFTGVDTSGDEPPPESEPDQIAGIDLTAPSRGALAATAGATDAVRVSVLDAPVVGDAGITNSIYTVSVPPSSPGGTVALAARLTGEKSAASAALTSVSQEVLFRPYGLNVAAFEIPLEAGQDGRLFSLIFGSQEVPYTPGTLFHFTDYFANGVANFRLRSLDGTGFADTVAGLPFVHGFRFVGEGVAQVWEVNVPVVPEPTTTTLLTFGAFAGYLRRRRRLD